jgi:hypothetical protein
MTKYLAEAYIYKNTAALVVTSEENGLEVNAEKTRYMVVLRSQCRTKSQHKDRQ